MSENGRKRLKLLNFQKFQMCKVLYYLVLTKGESRLENFKRDNIKIISKSKDRRDYVNVFIAARFGIKLSREAFLPQENTINTMNCHAMTQFSSYVQIMYFVRTLNSMINYDLTLRAINVSRQLSSVT